MARVTYPALIDREMGNDGVPVYGIVFPDLPGCVSVGDSIEEAIRSGEEALTGHIAAMVADGEALPAPTPLEDRRDQLVLWSQEDGTAAIVHVALVTVPLPSRSRRINVMLDDELIERIDAVTNNRSAFLAAAARAELRRR